MKKLIIGIMMVVMSLSLVYIVDVKAEEAEKQTIAGLDYVYTDLQTDTDTDSASGAAVELDLKESKYGNKTDGYQFTVGTGTLFASITGSKNKSLEWSSEKDAQGVDVPSAEYDMNGVKETTPVMAATSKNPWTEGTTPYFEVQVSTKGYRDIEFSAYVGASKKGPRDYQLAYAVGESSEYALLTGENTKISLAKNKEMTRISGILPEAANNQELVKVRVQVASMETVKSTEAAPVYLYTEPDSGEAAINHIAVTGTKLEAATASPVPTASVKPKATPKATPTVRPTVRTTRPSCIRKITKIKLNKKKLKLKKGKTYKLKVSVKATPKSYAKKARFTWKSSNKKVVSVSKKGKLKAKKKGKATITVRCKNNKKLKATCKVTVKAKKKKK